MLTRNTDGSYSVDWDAFEASITPETRLFILCNPHNPVGKVFQPEELAHLAEICLRHNVTIVADEVHCDLIYPESRHTPIATLDNEVAQNTITLMSPSKTYNLAGLQVSFAIIPNRELRKRYMFAGRSLIPWVNIFGLLAGQVAYQEGEEWLQEVLLYLKANRDYLLDFARQHLPGVYIGYPQGTYLAWLDCRQANLPIKPYQFFLEKARVALNDGEKFGPGGERFVRLNFACPRPLLQQGLERMREALQNNLGNRADD
jgi:cystathionine beta-lyase